MTTVYSVSQVNDYLKGIIESDSNLGDLWISGEITNFKFYQAGRQLYFNLVDAESQINCVVYDSFLKNIPAHLDNGLEVFSRGKIKFFHKKGTHIFQIVYLTIKKPGVQAQFFEELKQKLLKEGLFNSERKRPIPRFPSTIGLITAPNSAAMWDFVSIAGHRMPSVQLVLIPAVVQGLLAPPSLIEAIEVANTYKKFDYLVILRGGGSAEDLSAFNDEFLVRSITQSKIPIVSAVGHEVDTTLIDFASDLRLPTPSAAAHFLSEGFFEAKRWILDQIGRTILTLQQRVQKSINEIFDYLEDAQKLSTVKFRTVKERAHYLALRCEQASPLRKFTQGFSICKLQKTGEIVRSVKQISATDKIETQVFDGKFYSEIIVK